LEPDDLELVRRCKEGDQRAFRILVERYQKRVYAVAFGMVKDREEAMDIAQDAFVKVHKYLDHFKGDASFYTWIYRITANLAIDRIRARRVRDSVEFDDRFRKDEEGGGGEGILATRLGSNPQKAALRRELAEKIQGALEQIPEKHREILVLREVEGMSYEELAAVLKIPKGTVMSRLFHARAKMQRILGEYLGGDTPAGLDEDEG
jgi:RNA polymerase sigma-70 factor (ECF subfamily)